MELAIKQLNEQYPNYNIKLVESWVYVFEGKAFIKNTLGRFGIAKNTPVSSLIRDVKGIINNHETLINYEREQSIKH